jgi:transposase
METTRAIQAYCSVPTLYMALELSATKWVLLFSDGSRRRRKIVAAGDRQALQHEIALAKARFGLAGDTPTVSCYEAGRDGFWIHRWLLSIGVDNRVVDAASIEVPQHAKRVKTDRIDAEKLMDLLLRACRGDLRGWHEVRVPTVEQEDRRRVQRERQRLLKEAYSGTNRIKSLLATQGVSLALDDDFVHALEQVRCWDGAPLPPQLRQELLRQWQRHQLIDQQRRMLERQQREQQTAQMRQLQQLVSVGPQTSWVLCSEIFDWREITNGRELGALAGFTPTPYRSGNSEREQGISKAGIHRVRPAMVELSWLWLRWQPASAMAQWYQRRFADGSKRIRRIGIVALARKLLIALWRYLNDGVLPEGAALKGGAAA